MTIEQNLFLQILSYGLSTDSSIASPKVDKVDWDAFFSFCKSQAIVGIGFQCVDKLKNNLGDDLNLPRRLLLQWYGISEKIKARNKILNNKTKELTNYLTVEGKQSCILKGQGNALMYPEPLLRTPGDIDVWLDGSKKEIVEFVHRKYPGINVQYHHMDYPIFSDVEVEVHYFPSFCYNKWHNRRLQSYFRNESKTQFENMTAEGFNVPTVPFNLVFQLSHMMRHFFTQGIGLRHVIDYYYLLHQNITPEAFTEVVKVMKQCGLYKFFCSVMWIEVNILGLSYNNNFNDLNERAGKMLLREMLKGGNFGHQYKRSGKSAFIVFTKQMVYNLQYIFEFPLEPISRPFTLVWDYVRKRA